MILAAGRGERMRPLTDNCPKPLLVVRGKPLMQWPLEALARAGVTHVVVNTGWLGESIEQRFGDQLVLRPGVHDAPQPPRPNRVAITYSHEGRDFGGALETAGGIVRVLPLLGELFWVVAGDVFAPDFLFDQTAARRFAESGKLAHLWLVPNPAHHARGDFGLTDGLARNEAAVQYTFSGIGLYRRAFFASPDCAIASGNPQGIKARLAPMLRAAALRGEVSAELYRLAWADVGTPQRLHHLNHPGPGV